VILYLVATEIQNVTKHYTQGALGMPKAGLGLGPEQNMALLFSKRERVLLMVLKYQAALFLYRHSFDLLFVFYWLQNRRKIKI
jgi:hypothetical protein